MYQNQHQNISNTAREAFYLLQIYYMIKKVKINKMKLYLSYRLNNTNLYLKETKSMKYMNGNHEAILYDTYM